MKNSEEANNSDSRNRVNILESIIVSTIDAIQKYIATTVHIVFSWRSLHQLAVADKSRFTYFPPYSYLLVSSLISYFFTKLIGALNIGELNYAAINNIFSAESVIIGMAAYFVVAIALPIIIFSLVFRGNKSKISSAIYGMAYINGFLFLFGLPLFLSPVVVAESKIANLIVNIPLLILVFILIPITNLAYLLSKKSESGKQGLRLTLMCFSGASIIIFVELFSVVSFGGYIQGILGSHIADSKMRCERVETFERTTYENKNGEMIFRNDMVFSVTQESKNTIFISKAIQLWAVNEGKINKMEYLSRSVRVESWMDKDSPVLAIKRGEPKWVRLVFEHSDGVDISKLIFIFSGGKNYSCNLAR